MAGFLLLVHRLGRRVRRRPRAAQPRARRRLPGQPDHRPPRRAAARAAEHRLAAPGLGAARRHVVRRRSATFLPRPRRHAPLDRRWPPRSARSSPGRSRRSGAGSTASLVVRGRGVASCSRVAVVLQLTDGSAPCSTRCRPPRWPAGWSTASAAAGSAPSRLELVLIAVAVALGAVPGHFAARRAPRDELRVESGNYPARRLPRLAAGRAGAHRPRLGLARGADASRRRRPRDRARPSSRWPATSPGRR